MLDEYALAIERMASLRAEAQAARLLAEAVSGNGAAHRRASRPWLRRYRSSSAPKLSSSQTASGCQSAA